MSPRVVDRDSLLRNAVDFAFPPLCVGCEAVVPDGDILCLSCHGRIQRYLSPICLTCLSMIDQIHCSYCVDGGFLLYAYGDYSGPLRELVVAYKFSCLLSPSDWLANDLITMFREKIEAYKADALVPVALHPGREYFRGYNQALVFANSIADNLDVAVNIDMLWRTRRRRPQSRSRLLDRQKNVQGVFRAERVDGVETVILVDDVVTTGATVIEARRELVAAGYKVPAVLAIAHGE